MLADPYPLYHRLRNEDPVHWDPFLHAWVVTRYEDVMTVLHHYSADRTPTPEQLAALGMEAFSPVAEVMVRQMLYLDPPEHTRVRTLAAKGFTPSRVEALRDHIADIVGRLLDAVQDRRSHGRRRRLRACRCRRSSRARCSDCPPTTGRS